MKPDDSNIDIWGYAVDSSLLIMANLDPAHTQAVQAYDIFELHDLRVEVICPPNERILCGAKDGDYFVLEGEMLKFPPGQGFSIYSLSTDITETWVGSGSNVLPS